ncbi:hypothetical protein [Jeotgalibacillus sp. R-1-5s-1]|uniref:hypothetical protein n=1 Tax=Jeotgalibacillus sp. R-1-5s-1 TaxID=2555897 RepID=UPI001069BF33|nr:hypothetical protein [Jeotgalibacillus sp. R-1-5s-1]TFD97597.1 hypothetical protein E2491_09215 [Jeotgalibacillus sp. R-1-5s-1]
MKWIRLIMCIFVIPAAFIFHLLALLEIYSVFLSSLFLFLSILFFIWTFHYSKTFNRSGLFSRRH